VTKNAKTNGNKILNQGHDGNGKAVVPPHFASRPISEIPHGRKGKHNLIVSMILDDLVKVGVGEAVLVPLESLAGEKMENVRSALNRATRKRKMVVATLTDDEYFYVWRTEAGIKPGAAPLNLTSQNQQRLSTILHDRDV
jgi:hypothetical protein